MGTNVPFWLTSKSPKVILDIVFALDTSAIALTGTTPVHRHTNLCDSLEARLEMAEKVFAYCNYNLQLTMQILIRAAVNIEPLLAKRADNGGEIAHLIQRLRDQADSQEEKELLDAATPRWSFAEYYGELLRHVADGHDAAEAGAQEADIMLPLLLDNASWKAFVEFLRAKMRLAELGDGSREALISRTREFVRENQTLKSIVAERKRLQEQLSQLTSIIECASDAIVIYTIGGTIVSWNTAAESLYGYLPREVLGRSRYMLMEPDRRDDATGTSDKLTQRERMGLSEAIHIRKDGKRIRVSISLSPVKDVSGNVVGFAAITRQMSNSKAAPPSQLGEPDNGSL